MTVGSMSIGELSAKTGVAIANIRYYESEGLMKTPHRTAGGRRTYEAEDVLRLCYIRNARRLGFSTIETGGMLAALDSPNAPCKNLRDLLEEQAARVSRSIAELNHLKSELADQISACYNDCCDGVVSSCSAQKKFHAGLNRASV